MTSDKPGNTPFAMPAMPGLDEMQKQMAGFFEGAARAQGQVVDAMMKQNIEVLGFLRERMEKDRETFAALAAARDPAQAVELWTAFWQKATADYGDETGKVADLARGMAAEMLRAVNPAAAEAMAGIDPGAKPKGRK